MMVVLMSTMKMVRTWAVLGSEEVAAPATERMITVKHNTLVMVKIHRTMKKKNYRCFV